MYKNVAKEAVKDVESINSNGFRQENCRLLSKRIITPITAFSMGKYNTGNRFFHHWSIHFLPLFLFY